MVKDDAVLLKKLYQQSGELYFNKLRIDAYIPYSLKSDLAATGKSFSVRLANSLATFVIETLPKTLNSSTKNFYSESLDNSVGMQIALKQAQAVVTQHTAKLPDLFDSFDTRFRIFLSLLQEQPAESGKYLFISESDDRTCDSCVQKNGKLFTLHEAPIPPLHPNCRCSLIALDTTALAMYNINRLGLMAQLEQSLGKNGGVWQLHYNIVGSIKVGSVPFILKPVTPVTYPAIRENREDYFWYKDPEHWLADFWMDAENTWNLFWLMAEQRATHAFDSFSSFLDWLTVGIPSGLFDSAQERAEEMLADPNFENILNWLGLGFPSLVDSVLDPDEPMSFQHWMDSLQLITLLYGAYQTGAKVFNSDNFPRLPDVDVEISWPDHENNIEQRPSWQQSEIDIGLDYPEYAYQQSFINGHKTSYGKRGSVRPDFYAPGHSVEVKNYDITTASGRRSLVKTVVRQYEQRLEHLPIGTKQTVVADIRGQQVTHVMMRDLRNEILQQTHGNIEFIFKRGA